jgi:hypothetical protein
MNPWYDPNPNHTQWCARNHQCQPLGEHRADPIIVDLPGAGRALLTRVRAANGTDHAEIRMRIVLPRREADARTRLVALLTHLQTLIGPPRADRPHRRTAA